MTTRPMLYMAGPEVFLRDGAEVMRNKGELALAHGFLPSTMAEEALDFAGKAPLDIGMAIYRANVAMMDASAVIIANLTPFRGISADVGTVWELGYMVARGKRAFGYTNVAKPYFERLTEDFYAGTARREADGVIRGPDGLMVENHGMVDNLMIDGSLAEVGGKLVRRDVFAGTEWTDLAAFEECLALAKAALG